MRTSGTRDAGLAAGGARLTPAGARVADELLRRYRLGSPLGVELAPGGLLNQNLVARTADGPVFLKGYRYADPATVAPEHCLTLAFTQREPSFSWFSHSALNAHSAEYG
ncbi:MAG: hypothetical protein ACRDJN_03895 [Chloroflexota bacterium]